nr:uncharacterized protein LOC129421347 isoform X2 [Misgurnus anguillicaudatus]
MMGAVNVVLLVLLVWTSTAVCEDKTEITVNCEDVTALVGDKINLTCTVSNLNKGRCVKMYKFIDPAAADYPTICKEEFSKDPCKQESRLSCLYTANKLMTTTFTFFLQTNWGKKTTYFSVTTTGESNAFKGGEVNESTEETSGLDNSSVAVIICLFVCFAIVAVALFLWMRRKTPRPSHDCNTATCEHNISEHCDREAMLKETSVNVQIEKPCQCNNSITSS